VFVLGTWFLRRWAAVGFVALTIVALMVASQLGVTWRAVLIGTTVRLLPLIPLAFCWRRLK
jgi:hypothetical protein